MWKELTKKHAEKWNGINTRSKRENNSINRYACTEDNAICWSGVEQRERAKAKVQITFKQNSYYVIILYALNDDENKDEQSKFYKELQKEADATKYYNNRGQGKKMKVHYY